MLVETKRAQAEIRTSMWQDWLKKATHKGGKLAHAFSKDVGDPSSPDCLEGFGVDALHQLRHAWK
eukprot:5445418-Prorocentrum_lima.AAC.1